MIYRHPLPSSAQNSGFLIMVDLLCMLTVLTPREWSWGSWSCFKSSNSYVACCCHGPTIISGLSLVTHIENYALVGSTVFFEPWQFWWVPLSPITNVSFWMQPSTRKRNISRATIPRTVNQACVEWRCFQRLGRLPFSLGICHWVWFREGIGLSSFIIVQICI